MNLFFWRDQQPKHSIDGEITGHALMSELIQASRERRDDKGFDCALRGGDLRQLATQKAFLIGHGIKVGQFDYFPALHLKDYPRALKLIFDNRVDGWWNHRAELERLKVCSHVEFEEACRNIK